MRKAFFSSVVLVSFLTSGVSTIAGDWPAWRGVNRDDISTETGLLKTWPEGGPKKLWTSTAAGLGYSGMAVSEGVIYTMGADDAKEFVVALKVDDGSVVWQTPVGEVLDNDWGGGPRTTPSVSGNLVVVISGKGSLACLSTTDGAVKWSASLTELGGSIPNWGYCESALIDGDKVLCTPGGDQGTVACFSLSTGEKLWQSADITERAHYASIIAVNHFGSRQYIQLTQSKVFGLNADGKLQWSADWQGKTAVIPTPIYRNGQVYVTSGYGAGCMLVSVGPNNQVEKIYENKVMKNHHGGVILLGDHLYGHSDSVGWICQNLLTGEEVWNEDGKNGSKGSVTLADGMLYCLHEGSGTCVLAEASPSGWKEVSKFKLEPQTTKRSNRGKIWTHPVISNGRLYLRDQEIICCYDIQG